MTNSNWAVNTYRKPYGKYRGGFQLINSEGPYYTKAQALQRVKQLENRHGIGYYEFRYEVERISRKNCYVMFGIFC